MLSVIKSIYKKMGFQCPFKNFKWGYFSHWGWRGIPEHRSSNGKWTATVWWVYLWLGNDSWLSLLDPSVRPGWYEVIQQRCRIGLNKLLSSFLCDVHWCNHYKTYKYIYKFKINRPTIYKLRYTQYTNILVF